MGYLVLYVAVQVSNASLLKLGELYQQERLVMMGFNYLFATLLGAALWGVQGSGMPGGATLVLGPVGGIFYATSLLLWMGAITHAGLAVSTATMRISVICPTLLSLLVFAEMPTRFQWAGIVLTGIVLGLLAWNAASGGAVRRGDAARRGSLESWRLAALFLTMGAATSIQKLFNELGQPGEKTALLTLIYGAACLLTWIGILAGRRPLRRGDLLRGLLFGATNIGGNLCLLLALEHVPGVVAFPFVNIGSILLISLLGIVLWRERPGRSGLAAIALALPAIVLMAL
jgi:drug/metabolite transporter (DMT)-like permease